MAAIILVKVEGGKRIDVVQGSARQSDDLVCRVNLISSASRSEVKAAVRVCGGIAHDEFRGVVVQEESPYT